MLYKLLILAFSLEASFESFAIEVINTIVNTIVIAEVIISSVIVVLFNYTQMHIILSNKQ